MTGLHNQKGFDSSDGQPGSALPSQTGSGSQTGPASPVQSPAKMSVAWLAAEGLVERIICSLEPLAVGLIDEFVNLTILCPAGASVQGIPSPPAEVIVHDRIGWLGMRTSPAEELAGQLVDKGIRIIHALDSRCAALACRLAELAGVPFLVSADSPHDAAAIKSLPAAPAAVLAASEPVRQAVAAQHVLPAEAIRLVRPGLHQVRHATCFDNPFCRTSVLAGGDLGDLRSFQALLQAFDELRQKSFDCMFFIMGRGRCESRLRKMAVDIGLNEDVSFIEDRPLWELPTVIRACDIYVSPGSIRRVDVWSLVAMSCGVPVVAVGGRAGDHLIDCQTATLVRPYNAPNLAAAVQALLDDKALARAQAERALDYLRQNHSAAGMVAQVAEIYRQTVESAKSPAASLAGS
ncbi:MAG: glycosyltransferase family 4 protein [Planctomycetes bacterium]|nr:glycosyltransferase family 4 protein [Planctomycetota bacterium]